MDRTPPRRAARRLLPVTALVLSILATWTSCSAPAFDAKAMVEEWAAYMQRDYVLRPGDEIAISVYENEDLTQERVIDPNGTVALLRIDEPVKLAGHSVEFARKQVERAYADVLQSPEISLSLAEVGASSVYVGGEVRRPGPVAWVPGMTVAQAVAAAGSYGITAKANDVRVLRNSGTLGAKTYRVNLEETLHDGAPDFLVLPNDVVWCQTSGIADVGNWIQLYIVRLLPFPSTGVPPVL